jgi:hypothetical protein
MLLRTLFGSRVWQWADRLPARARLGRSLVAICVLSLPSVGERQTLERHGELVLRRFSPGLEIRLLLRLVWLVSLLVVRTCALLQ